MDEPQNQPQKLEDEIRKAEARLRELKVQKAGNAPATDRHLPVAILVGSAMIAASLYFSLPNLGPLLRGAVSPTAPAAPTAPSTLPSAIAPSAAGDIVVQPVSAEDHVFGDPNAAVAVIEFSDLECPFCQRLHPTLKQIVADYDGQVKWVYRHFPLDVLHQKARKEAEATECANELGGNDAFWAYLDRLFEITPSNDGLAASQLPQIAEDVGLNRGKFEECLNSGRYAQHIADDVAQATAAGGAGTPYTVILAPDGTTYPVSGAQPASAFSSLIDLALQGI